MSDDYCATPLPDEERIMSDIEIYNPVGKCKRCMGSGHIWKTVYMLDSLDGHMLIIHCPECNGTGKENISESEKDV